MTEASSPLSTRVPVHSLGISQILSYGLMFYAFAALKTPVAAATSLGESTVLTILSMALILQAILMPIVGSWCDRHGALSVMRIGFLTGAAGIAGLGFAGAVPVPTMIWLTGCFLLVGTGLAMSTYEVAFSAAVQLHEAKSRRSISIITFYGGVASSLTWLSIHPLLEAAGLTGTCLVISGALVFASLMIGNAARRAPRPAAVRDAATAPFRWSLLQSSEKRAMLLLAGSGALEYLLFATTTLLWINWFDAQFGSLALAVMLASIYGPFQVVGRVLEMKAGHHLDARLTGLIAAFLVPVSLMLVQIQSIPMAVLAMALFGMGHGVLTVSFGFVTNLYFRAEIYGRAKGIIATPRAFGAAIGPGVGGLLFGLGSDVYMGLMIALSVGATVLFASLLLLTPTNEVHAGKAR